MAGFLPVGSFPVASVPSGGGVNYSPVTVTITYEGGLAPTVKGISPIVSMQVAREVLRNSTADLISRAIVRETLRSQDAGTDTRIITRAMVRETLRSQDFSTDTEIVTRQIVREVLRSAGVQSVALRRRQLILPNVGPFR